MFINETYCDFYSTLYVFFVILQQNGCKSVNPCLNGGTCKTDQNNKFRCECMPGYYGTTCADNACKATNPCLNGGRCKPGAMAGGFTCECMPGYHGTNCAVSESFCIFVVFYLYFNTYLYYNTYY